MEICPPKSNIPSSHRPTEIEENHVVKMLCTELEERERETQDQFFQRPHTARPSRPDTDYHRFAVCSPGPPCSRHTLHQFGPRKFQAQNL